MRATYCFEHLGNHDLDSTVDSYLAKQRSSTAILVALLAEVDARRFFVQAGYSSMQAWCVGAKGMSEDMALKWIQVARAARDFPALLPPLARLPAAPLGGDIAAGGAVSTV